LILLDLKRGFKQPTRAVTPDRKRMNLTIHGRRGVRCYTQKGRENIPIGGGSDLGERHATITTLLKKKKGFLVGNRKRRNPGKTLGDLKRGERKKAFLFQEKGSGVCRNSLKKAKGRKKKRPPLMRKTIGILWKKKSATSFEEGF